MGDGSVPTEPAGVRPLARGVMAIVALLVGLVAVSVGSVAQPSALARLAKARATSPRPAQPLWTVLTERESAALLRPCSRRVPEGLSGWWTPIVESITEVETKLDGAVMAALATVSPELLRASPSDKRSPARRVTYYRQYGGVIRDGKRLIYVHALATWLVDGNRELSRTWRTKVLRACDFGINGFGALFDPASGGFVAFDFDY